MATYGTSRTAMMEALLDADPATAYPGPVRQARLRVLSRATNGDLTRWYEALRPAKVREVETIPLHAPDGTIHGPGPAPSWVNWLTVRVDEDGRMVVRDEVEGIESEPIETVMCPARMWAAGIEKAILDLLVRNGMSLD